jgi:transposase
MQTDYAGHTIPIIDPATGDEHRAQIFVAVLGASNYTFAWASLSQKLSDWIDAQVRALHFFGGGPSAVAGQQRKPFRLLFTPVWRENHSIKRSGSP